MKARRSPIRGPLLTFGMMIGSVLVVVAVSRYFDLHKKAEPQPVSSTSTVSVSSSGESPSSSHE